MISTTTTVRGSLTLVAAIAVGLVLAAPAYAGSCPADKLRPDGSGEKMNATPAKDVSDTVLTSIDLAKEPAAVKDRLLRLRRLEIKPGGVVPWHAHGNRPAIIYIVQGEIVEYRQHLRGADRAPCRRDRDRDARDGALVEEHRQ